MYQNVQTCILEVNSTRIDIKLPVDIVWGLHSHTQRARLQPCIAVAKNTQIHESPRGNIRRAGLTPMQLHWAPRFWGPRPSGPYAGTQPGILFGRGPVTDVVRL